MVDEIEAAGTIEAASDPAPGAEVGRASDPLPLAADEPVGAAHASAAERWADFHAADRYHAITYLTQAVWGTGTELKERLLTALRGMSHMGPVHVMVPAPPAVPLGVDGPAGGEVKDADPTAPDDGAFAIRPVHFVQV